MNEQKGWIYQQKMMSLRVINILLQQRHNVPIPEEPLLAEQLFGAIQVLQKSRLHKRSKEGVVDHGAT